MILGKPSRTPGDLGNILSKRTLTWRNLLLLLHVFDLILAFSLYPGEGTYYGSRPLYFLPLPSLPYSFLTTPLLSFKFIYYHSPFSKITFLVCSRIAYLPTVTCLPYLCTINVLIIKNLPISRLGIISAVKITLLPEILYLFWVLPLPVPSYIFWIVQHKVNHFIWQATRSLPPKSTLLWPKIRELLGILHLSKCYQAAQLAPILK